MIEVVFVLVVIAAAGAYWAWNALRGEGVGTAKAVIQGDYSVPGTPVRVVVKRHMSGGRPERVEIQLWTWGVTKAFTLDPLEAVAMAQAIEQAAAEIRGES